ncbi:FkbM family methyltransferase [Streptomyces sp. MUM 178J]|uniref:FkbM family methyltransferase n=1 Tax=Streptomyces sp. MUM 178J TaxID=2791991 RepID=UPI001F038EF7|nr:FkbM family methyltransferase [Streptomyces sp. MUM 178J]WRQ82209.1 FkbM family methyltransferase [Streptomyces sp. MUM 178J]
MTTTSLRSTAISIRNGIVRRSPAMQRLIQQGATRKCLPKALYRRLQPIGVATLHAPDGSPFRYECFEEDGFGRMIVWRDMRDWERTTQPLLYSLAKKSRVFVDVGAHTGIYSILGCLANPELRVIACEPNPGLAERIRANAALNGLTERLTVVAAALSDAPGNATLSIPRRRTHAASLRAPLQGETTLEAEVTTGDALLSGMPVDLVKIDVEGLESQVLGGMSEILRTRAPHLIIECLDSAALESARRVVTPAGYRHVYHISAQGIVPVTGRFRDPDLLYTNFLFCARPYSD